MEKENDSIFGALIGWVVLLSAIFFFSQSIVPEITYPCRSYKFALNTIEAINQEADEYLTKKFSLYHTS